jgi:hypothetical protein
VKVWFLGAGSSQIILARNFWLKMKSKTDEIGLITLYEKRLKELNPGVRNIQYNVNDFNTYLDHLADACALVYVLFGLNFRSGKLNYYGCMIRFDNRALSYVPHDREWLKAKVSMAYIS